MCHSKLKILFSVAYGKLLTWTTLMSSSCSDYSCVKLRMLIQMRLRYPFSKTVSLDFGEHANDYTAWSFPHFSTFIPIFSFARKKIKNKLIQKTFPYNACNLVTHTAITSLSFYNYCFISLPLGFWGSCRWDFVPPAIKTIDLAYVWISVNIPH